MYMFDTNTVSHLFRQHPQVLNVMEKLPPSAVCISSVTEAELLYGVAKRRNKALQSMVEAFLAAVTVYAWDSEAARCYGEMRANMERKGKIMGARRAHKEKASPREIGPAKEVVPSIAMQIFSLFVLSSVIVTKLRAH